jgi:predicted dehydrogenase
MAEREPDSEATVREAIQEIREARKALHERVVLAVQNRNRMQDEIALREREIADIETKAALAERINRVELAAELRAERKKREGELIFLRQKLTEAETNAESAKMRLPEEEARLLLQVNALQAQLVQAAESRMRAHDELNRFSPSEEAWQRASEKVRDLGREASARDEVAGIRGGQPSSGSLYTPTPRAAPLSHDDNAEQQLSDLETRLGIAPAIQTEAAASTGANTRFLELDDTPASSAGEVDNASSEISRPAPSRTAAITPQRVAAPETPFQILKPNEGESSPMDPTKRIRVAAIGNGNIFRGAHLPCYPDIANAQLVAFCDPDPLAQKATRKRYDGLIDAKIAQCKERGDTDTVERLERDREQVKFYEDISQIISEVKPDLVDICTQPVLHAPLAIQALDAGINVMCEKPISRSWLESERVIAAVKRSGKVYQHNENWLFEPDYYTVKKLVDAGAIGELVMMFLTQAHGGPEGNPRFWNSDFGGGGALLDNGIHAIGAAWYVTGLEKTPTQVKAAAPFGMSIRMPTRIIDGRLQQVTVDDDAHILIRFEDAQSGAWSTAHVEGSWSEQDSPDTAYIGTTGSIKMLDVDGKRFAVVTDAHGHESRRLRVSGSNWQHWPSSFYGEIQNMVECLRNGVPSVMTAEFGADCSAIVGCSYLSEKNGKRAVTLDEFRQFARDIAARYPNDPTGADNALVDSLLSAVRDKK